MMDAMTLLIVDDEPPARDRLRRLVAELPGYAIAGEAETGLQALDAVAKSRPDVVLMDIRMPGMDGLEAARHLAKLDEPPAVIFTTAYDQYAVEAFDANAIGYLLKPVRREKLAAALASAARLTRPQMQRATAAGARAPERRSHLAARHRDELRLIPVEDVLYFVADQKYTTVRDAHGEHLIEDSLRQLEEEFAPTFVRIHRGALVNVRHLEAIERDVDGRYQVRLRGIETRLPVSRRIAAELRERFTL